MVNSEKNVLKMLLRKIISFKTKTGSTKFLIRIQFGTGSTTLEKTCHSRFLWWTDCLAGEDIGDGEPLGEGRPLRLLISELDEAGPVLKG